MLVVVVVFELDGMVAPWFLPTFLEITDVPSVHYAVLLPSVETCVARVLGRTDPWFREEPSRATCTPRSRSLGSTPGP